MPRHLLASAVALTFLHLCIPSPAQAQASEGSVPAGWKDAVYAKVAD